VPLSSVGRRLASARDESEPTMRGASALPIVLWIMLSCACAADALSSQDAAKHIGESATVCGTVVSTNYASRTKRLPTFLNFDQPYPHQIFTVVIWGSDRAKFGTPEVALMGKRVCARGIIQMYQGRPEIIASDPQQLDVQ